MERRNALLNNVYLLTVIFFLLTVALIYTKSILVPFIISVFIYASLSPLIYWFQVNLKMKRIFAIGITLSLFLIIAAVLVLMMTSSFESFFQSADVYKLKLLGFIEWGAEKAKSLGYELDSTSIKSELSKLPFLKITKGFTGGLLSFVGNVSLIMIFVMFLLIGGGEGARNQLIHEIHFKISRYISTKIVLSMATAFLVWIILVIFKVELASTFAIMTFLLNFIPNIGSVIATILPLPLVLLQFGLGASFWLVLGLSLFVQFLVGNVLEPKIMGESLDLHPITVLIFLMFWGLVWGIPGMFMAVPITAIMKIIFSRLEATRPLSELLAGRIN